MHDLIKGGVNSIDYVNIKPNMENQFTKQLSRSSIEFLLMELVYAHLRNHEKKPNSTLEETSSLEFNVD